MPESQNFLYFEELNAKRKTIRIWQCYWEKTNRGGRNVGEGDNREKARKEGRKIPERGKQVGQGRWSSGGEEGWRLKTINRARWKEPSFRNMQIPWSQILLHKAELNQIFLVSLFRRLLSYFYPLTPQSFSNWSHIPLSVCGGVTCTQRWLWGFSTLSSENSQLPLAKYAPSLRFPNVLLVSFAWWCTPWLPE